MRARSAGPSLPRTDAALSLTRSSRLLGLRDDRLALRGGVALTEQAVEQLARVVLHRQRLRAGGTRSSSPSRSPNSVLHVPPLEPRGSMQSSSDGNGVSCPISSRDDLIGRHAALRLVEVRQERRRAPSHVPGIHGMHARAFGGFVAQPADDRHLIFERCERRQDLRQLETAPARLAESSDRSRRRAANRRSPSSASARSGLRERRARRNHRIEQRQRNRRADAREETFCVTDASW